MVVGATATAGGCGNGFHPLEYLPAFTLTDVLVDGGIEDVFLLLVVGAKHLDELFLFGIRFRVMLANLVMDRFEQRDDLSVLDAHDLGGTRASHPGFFVEHREEDILLPS